MRRGRFHFSNATVVTNNFSKREKRKRERDKRREIERGRKR